MSDWQGFDINYLYTGGAGLLGRLMFHSRLVQQGKRKPISWALLTDIPIALGMGWTALGIGVWLGLPQQVTVSIGIAFGHLGPVVIDRVFTGLIEKHFGEKE